MPVPGESLVARLQSTSVPGAALEALVSEANDANRAGDHAAACAKFEEAYWRTGRIAHLLSGANMRLRLGEHAVAARVYTHVLEQQNATEREVAVATRKLAECKQWTGAPAAAPAPEAVGGVEGGVKPVPAGVVPDADASFLQRVRKHLGAIDAMGEAEFALMTPRTLERYESEAIALSQEARLSAPSEDASGTPAPHGGDRVEKLARAHAERVGAESPSGAKAHGAIGELQTLLRAERELRALLRARLDVHSEAESALRRQLAEAKSATPPGAGLTTASPRAGDGDGVQRLTARQAAVPATAADWRRSVPAACAVASPPQAASRPREEEGGAAPADAAAHHDAAQHRAAESNLAAHRELLRAREDELRYMREVREADRAELEQMAATVGALSTQETQPDTDHNHDDQWDELLPQRR